VHMHHARQAAWRAWKLSVLALAVAALLCSATHGVAAARAGERGDDDGSSAGKAAAARAPSPAMALLSHIDLGAWRRRGSLIAAAAASGSGGRGTANIKHIALIGERHHGTNYVVAMLDKNVAVGNVTNAFCQFKVSNSNIGLPAATSYGHSTTT
jgi:hypothetical protein